MADRSSSQEHAFDETRLKRLIELMKEHDLQELELGDADQQIRIRRGSTAAGAAAPPGMPPGYYSPYPAPPPMHHAAPAPSSAAPAGPASGGETEGDHIVLIRSPMVGTFYGRPNPNAPAYVKVGDHVDAETTICIIEAMKVFNEIPAEVNGKVVAVLVDDEEPVEFGKPLFKVDTRG